MQATSTHTRPIIRRNQYGGTVGGPVIKNKTFFFFDMQFTKQRGTSAFNNLTVPSPAFRNGDFSSLVVGNNAVPIYDPAVLPISARPFAGNAFRPRASALPRRMSRPSILSRKSPRISPTTPTSVRSETTTTSTTSRSITISPTATSSLRVTPDARRTPSPPALSRIPKPAAAIRASSDSGQTRITAVRPWSITSKFSVRA